MQGNAEQIIRSGGENPNQGSGNFSSFDASDDITAILNGELNKSNSPLIRNATKDKVHLGPYPGQNKSLEVFEQIKNTLMHESTEKGIIQRVIDQVFANFQRAKLDATCQIRVSFLEIYNDSVTDLLEDGLVVENSSKPV